MIFFKSIKISIEISAEFFLYQEVPTYPRYKIYTSYVISQPDPIIVDLNQTHHHQYNIFYLIILQNSISPKKTMHNSIATYYHYINYIMHNNII
jgi:hypothetical protein